MLSDRYKTNKVSIQPTCRLLILQSNNKRGYSTVQSILHITLNLTCSLSASPSSSRLYLATCALHVRDWTPDVKHVGPLMHLETEFAQIAKILQGLCCNSSTTQLAMLKILQTLTSTATTILLIPPPL